MMRRLVLAGVLSLGFAGLAAADSVGFRRMELADQPARVLEAAIWYPTRAAGSTTRFGDNAAFEGVPVIVDAPPEPGRHRLVVLSHGYGGNLANQAWLAAALAARGYVVAAVNHPGTTSRNRKPDIGARLWERPRDLSRLIDGVTRDSALGIDADKLGVVGHSLGGWTALALAGARFDPALFDADCAVNATLAACKVYRALGAGETAEARAALAGNMRDPRIGAAVALDLGLARGFTPSSLAAVEVPVLVVAAMAGEEGIPAALESRYLADHLPPTRVNYVTLDGAAHFSFLPICKPGAVELLEADTPGDGIICRDGAPNADRAALHARTADEVAHFLDAALGPP